MTAPLMPVLSRPVIFIPGVFSGVLRRLLSITDLVISIDWKKQGSNHDGGR